MALEDLEERVKTLEGGMASIEKDNIKSETLLNQLKEVVIGFQHVAKDISDTNASIQSTMSAMQVEIKLNGESQKKMSDKLDKIYDLTVDVEKANARISTVEENTKNSIKRVNERVDEVNNTLNEYKKETNKKIEETTKALQDHDKEQKIDVVSLIKQVMTYVFVALGSGAIVWIIIASNATKP